MLGFGKKTKPVAKTLADEQMRLIDFIVLIDNSGSMGSPSRRVPGKTRLGEVEADVMRIAAAAEAFDDDGITVIQFGSNATTYDGVGALKVASVFKTFPPAGSTNLAAGLRNAADKAKASQKQVVVICYTDGQPDSRAEAMAVIDKLGRGLGRPKVGFTFIQVGDDPTAAEFLDALDNDMSVDVCATVRAIDAEGLSVSQLAWLAQNA